MTLLERDIYICINIKHLTNKSDGFVFQSITIRYSAGVVSALLTLGASHRGWDY